MLCLGLGLFQHCCANVWLTFFCSVLRHSTSFRIIFDCTTACLKSVSLPEFNSVKRCWIEMSHPFGQGLVNTLSAFTGSEPNRFYVMHMLVLVVTLEWFFVNFSPTRRPSSTLVAVAFCINRPYRIFVHLFLRLLTTKVEQRIKQISFLQLYFTFG